MSEPTPVKVNLHLTPNGTGSTLIVGGVDISNRVYKVEIVAEVGKPTNVTVYAHLIDVTALGDTWAQYIASPREVKRVDDDVAVTE